ncbi:MAG: carboxypeptidase regulatory-like domain-containing protein, partial [Chloracidobacterium sp.]|nr:carboxypeptidase regulatory-like domain-containing protein [Chloracidobacterium sp.]
MKSTRQIRFSVIRPGVILAALLLFILIFKPLSAQESRATLEGRVTDQQGAIIPRATVEVTSEQTGVKQRTTANDQGAWTLNFLNPGAFTITISAPNFKTFERRGVTLQVADRKQIDTMLELGEVSDHVVVTAETPLIDTNSATSGTVITSQEISEMPSMSRVATLLATLSPGVVAQDLNNNIVRMFSYIGASQFEADGGRDIRSNNFQLDGLPNVKSGGYISFIPPSDSLQEFRVQTNAYDASIGRQAGSTINMTTKSGAKDYHGSLFWFNQNNFLNAALFQTNLTGAAKPPVHFNEYGGTFGGPVRIP